MVIKFDLSEIDCAPGPARRFKAVLFDHSMAIFNLVKHFENLTTLELHASSYLSWSHFYCLLDRCFSRFTRLRNLILHIIPDYWTTYAHTFGKHQLPKELRRVERQKCRLQKLRIIFKGDIREISRPNITQFGLCMDEFFKLLSLFPQAIESVRSLSLDLSTVCESYWAHELEHEHGKEMLHLPNLETLKITRKALLSPVIPILTEETMGNIKSLTIPGHHPGLSHDSHFEKV